MDWVALQQLGGTAGAIAVAGVAAWKSWRTERQTRATGNGWADRIEDKVDAIDDKLDRHIEAHANAQIGRRR